MVEAGIAEVEAARSDARKTVPDPKDRILSTSMLLTENVSTNLTPRRWPPRHCHLIVCARACGGAGRRDGSDTDRVDNNMDARTAGARAHPEGLLEGKTR